MSLNATLSVAEKHIYMVGFHSQQLRDILADVPDVGQKVTLFQQTSTTASSAIKASRSTTTTTTPPSPSFAGGGSGGGGGGLKWLQEQHLYARQLESGQLEVVDRHFNLSDLDAVSEGHETALATPPSLIFINAANKATARVIARHAKQLKIPVYIPDIPGNVLPTTTQHC